MKRVKCGLGLWMAVVLTTLMSLPSALGETETVGGVTWIYMVEDGKATVTGATPAEGTMTIPSKLGGCAVTEIGYQAFQKNSKITVLSIPDSVKNIGESAFEGCTGLQAVTIGNSVTNIGKAAFGACSALSSLTLGKGVMSIGNSAFEYCTKLTVVKIPDSVTSIGKYAFRYCRGLTSVTIPDSVINIGIGAFEECTRLQAVTIGNSVTSIGGDAFYNCRGLTSVTIGNSVTSIGGHAFYKCTSLTSVAIPNSVTSIESDAFRSCSRLTSVTIGNSVTNIGDRAFQDCSGLTSVTIPDSVTSIGDGVFSGCSELNTLYVPASWKGTSMLDYAGVPEDCTVVYVVKEQSVTFDANGGTCGTSSRIYAVGQTYSSFPAATRERYAFAGWWTEATGGQRVLESDTVQAIETRTLYAHWTWLMAEQEVTFNPNGGICDTATKTYSVGGKYTPLPVAVSVREHYAFAGWWTSAEGGEQVTNTSTVTAAETRTLYAHWTLAEQVVTFNPNGGTCDTATKTYSVGGRYTSLPVAVSAREHYAFAGWWSSAEGGEQVTNSSTVTAAETRTLYAHWLLAEQVVTFDANGGRCGTEQGTFDIGKTYGPLPTPTKDCYAFAGWWTSAQGGEQVTAADTVPGTETRTLYAHWTLAEQQVTFNANGGGCDITTKTYALGETYGSFPLATCEHYAFAGWWTSVDGGERVTAASTVPETETRTLYAHWSDVAAAKVEECTADVGEGKGIVRFTGQAGVMYVLQCRQKLESDEIWTTVATKMAEEDGMITMMAEMPEGWTSAFYRVVADWDEPYLIVDMSEGQDAESWPVTILETVPEGGWTYEYKTKKLVLRMIPPGTFVMGSPTNELGRDDREIQHTVTLTKAYYMGVFEVTQRQWELAMGNRPSAFNITTYYASRPVESVSYDDIRGSSSGAGWPATNAVDATSFLGVLRAKTGLAFDLPTEAQWEYACRAGTTTALNSGKNLTRTDSCPNMGELGRYSMNAGVIDLPSSSHPSRTGTAYVGEYQPNAWGLYDMHGNVWEWCLDYWWYWSYDIGDSIDPEGCISSSYRVLRGGCWDSVAQGCRSAIRNYRYPSDRIYYYGFRLCCPAGLP